MGQPLRALIVEDLHPDALMLVCELTRGGFDVAFERVDSADTMNDALATQPWDIVISDYALPRFSGLAALALVKERNLDLPFIIVSGTVGEETAVEAIRAGAHDFMTKGKYARLIPAVERALHDAALRTERAKMQTERAKMQEQLIISDRMASVGTLAAGVAHELNNPLAALIANLDFSAQDVARLAQDVGPNGMGANDPGANGRGANGRGANGRGANGRDAEPGELDWMTHRLQEIAEPLRDAREASERVRHIVRDLMIFSRPNDEELGAVDVRRVMESAVRMAWNEIRHRARLVKDYADVPPVYANEARLGQVFLNLVVNAAQAMPEGRADKNEIRVTTREAGDGRVVVEIRDTGSGIPEAARSRIFDPFFTTKPIGVGTGLGLTICHRIVTALGGEIEVDSEVGKGTVVRAVFNVAKSDHADAPAGPVATGPGRRGKILIVDDEPTLASAVQRTLSSDHDVVAVTKGSDALGLLHRGDRFDVILCDLMMPEVTGMDLHHELARVAPDQAERMIFMTGGAFTTRARAFLNQARNPRLEKPFDGGALRALIHGLLR